MHPNYQYYNTTQVNIQHIIQNNPTSSVIQQNPIQGVTIYGKNKTPSSPSTIQKTHKMNGKFSPLKVDISISPQKPSSTNAFSFSPLSFDFSPSSDFFSKFVPSPTDINLSNKVNEEVAEILFSPSLNDSFGYLFSPTTTSTHQNIFDGKLSPEKITEVEKKTKKKNQTKRISSSTLEQVPDEQLTELEIQKKKRMMKNRLTAQASRERKNNHIIELETKISGWDDSVSQINKMVNSHNNRYRNIPSLQIPTASNFQNKNQWVETVVASLLNQIGN